MTRNYRDFYSIILVQFVVIQLVVIPIISPTVKLGI